MNLEQLIQINVLRDIEIMLLKEKGMTIKEVLMNLEVKYRDSEKF